MWIFKLLLSLSLTMGLMIGMTGCEAPSDDDKEVVDDGNGGNGDDTYGDGTVESPVVITITSEQSGSVAGYSSSFYQFDVAAPSDLNLTITASDAISINVILYDDAGLTNAVFTGYASGAQTEHSFNYIQLDTAGTYYLQIDNDTDSGTAYTMSFAQNPYHASEGTTTAPITLETNTTHQASISAYGTSYYQFDVNETGYYSLAMTNGSYSSSPQAYIYSDAELTQTVWSYYDSGDIIMTETGTYYMTLYNNDNHGVGFDLVIGQDAPAGGEGSVAAPVAITTLGQTNIVIDSSFPSYYLLTVENDGYYKIDTGSYNHTAYLYDDAAFSNQVATGTYSGASLVTPLLEAGTSYYLKVTSTTEGTATLNMTTLSEGSTTGPVALPLGTIHDGVVGAASDVNNYDNSYYTFTTDTAGDYTIVLKSNMDTDVYLYSNAAFTTQVASSISTDYQGETLVTSLAASTQYYIKINTTSTSTSTTPIYTLRVLKTATSSDGTVASPTAVTVGTPFSGGMTSADGVSYYKFTTTDQTVYNIFVSDVSNHTENVTLDVYTDSAFTNKIGSTSSGSYPLHLELNSTTAYIKMSNSGLTYNVNYDVRVYQQQSNQGATNALVPLTLGSDQSAAVGTSSELSQYSFYKVTLSEAGDYNFSSSGNIGSSDLYQQLGQLSNLSTGSAVANAYTNAFVYNYRHDGNETLYLKTQNYTDDQNLTYTLNVSKEAAATATDEGPIDSPVNISAYVNGIAYPAKTGTSASLADTSHYSFATGASSNDGYYQVTATNHSVASQVTFKTYSDAAYTSLIANKTDTVNIPVTASTTYYLSAYESSNEMTFDMSIDRISEGIATSPVSIIIVNTGLDTNHMVGAANSSDNSDNSYYTYSSVGTEHNISVANVTGVAASSLAVRPYQSNCTTTISYSPLGDGRIYFTTGVGGPYCLKVTNSGSANATYDLNVTSN